MNSRLGSLVVAVGAMLVGIALGGAAFVSGALAQPAKPPVDRSSNILPPQGDEPPPTLQFLFVARTQLGKPVQFGRTPAGQRTIVPVIPGGRFEGPRLSGRILEGGADVQRLREDGVLELDAHGVLETDDGVKILYHNTGLRWFPEDVAAAMREGRPFDPARVYSRAAPRFEAPTESPYSWLNRAVFISIPARDGAGIKLTVWQVL